MGLKNNLELKGGLYREALLIRCIFLFTGQEMSLYLEGLINVINGAVGGGGGWGSWGSIGISLH